jgi:hypothetical protein
MGICHHEQESGPPSKSEVERDLICEMIGDEPGAQAKRRKKIEEMSEEAAMIERIKHTTRRGQGLSLGKLPLIMMVFNLVGRQSRPAKAFTAYDCSNRSNIVESYSLLEPDACAVSDRTEEFKTAVYGKILQMMQDWIIVSSIVSQYCGHWSTAGVT